MSEVLAEMVVHDASFLMRVMYAEFHSNIENGTFSPRATPKSL